MFGGKWQEIFASIIWPGLSRWRRRGSVRARQRWGGLISV